MMKIDIFRCDWSIRLLEGLGRSSLLTKKLLDNGYNIGHELCTVEEAMTAFIGALVSCFKTTFSLGGGNFSKISKEEALLWFPKVSILIDSLRKLNYSIMKGSESYQKEFVALQVNAVAAIERLEINGREKSAAAIERAERILKLMSEEHQVSRLLSDLAESWDAIYQLLDAQKRSWKPLSELAKGNILGFFFQSHRPGAIKTLGIARRNDEN